MLSRTQRVATTVALAAGLAVSGAVLSPAAACGGGGVACPPPETPATDGRTVTVTVTGSFIRGGSEGSSGSGSTTVSVPTPCWFTPLWTGKEYAEGIENGSITGAGSDEADAGTWKPNEGYQQHADDDKGRWYHGVCSPIGEFADDWDGFEEFAENFFDENPGVFVEFGATPPVPDIPPEVLLEAAQEAMEMPEPVFDYNPQRTGDAATLVNLDTWFWQEDRTEDGSVTASAGANSVTVDASLDDVTYVGDNAGAVTCADAGTPYAPGASSDCLLQFVRSGSNAVTASSIWNLSWSYNGTPMGTLDAIGATWQTAVNVVESQALVTEVG